MYLQISRSKCKLFHECDSKTFRYNALVPILVKVLATTPMVDLFIRYCHTKEVQLQFLITKLQILTRKAMCNDELH